MRRDAVVDRQQAALAEGPHAALLGFDAEDLRAGVLDDHVAHLVVEQHDLVDALAAAVAGVVAVVAALAVVEDAGPATSSGRSSSSMSCSSAGRVLGLAVGADACGPGAGRRCLRASR